MNIMSFVKLFEGEEKVSRAANDALRMAADRMNLLSSEENKNKFFVQESYKTLRTNVRFSLAEVSECKVIAVTSAAQGEGKSITAANLAIAFSQADERVLLIDCDLRRPKLARLMQMHATCGLTNVLLDRSLLPKAILHYGDSRLDVMLAGNIPPNPSELLGSTKMNELLSTLRKSYDFIILDTPPVNVVIDTVTIAPQTNGVLFVARGGHSDRMEISYSLQQLSYAKAKVLGFVLNGISAEMDNYGYRKRYGRYGHYGRRKKYGYGRYGKYGYGKYGYGKYGYGKYGYGSSYSKYGYGKYGYGGNTHYNYNPEAERKALQELDKEK